MQPLLVGILLFIALVLFIVAALAPERRPSFVPWGLASWVASQLLPLLFRLFVIGLILGMARIALAQDPIPSRPPAGEGPWYTRPHEISGWLMIWLAVLTGFAMAALTAWGRISAKMDEIKSRQDRASEEKRQLQQNVTSLATMIDPKGHETKIPPVVVPRTDADSGVGP